MARMEFQISTPVLLETLQQLLEQRLYATCFVSPIPGLYLDYIEVGVQGPITQPSHLVPAALNIQMSAKIFVATAEEVQAAQGGPPADALTSGGVPLTANIVASVSGTKFSATYDGIVHDAFYSSLEQLVADFVGGLAKAKQLFSKWERTLKKALASTSLIDFDFKKLLPSQVQDLPNGRSALCADSESGVIAARFEVGQRGSDGTWHGFQEGKLGALIGPKSWGLFITGDALVDGINDIVQEQIGKAAAGIPFTVTGEFGLLAKSGPLPFYPLESIAPETGSVTTTATVDFSVTVEIWGAVSKSQGDIQAIATLVFTLNKPKAGSHTDPTLDMSLYYSLQESLGFWPTLAANFGINLNQYVPTSLSTAPSGFKTTSVPNFFTSQTALPPVVLERVLTLTASGCTGAVMPPVSAGVQAELAALNNVSTSGFGINPPGSGLLISGPAEVASGKSRPDCTVSSTPFALVFNTLELPASERPYYIIPPPTPKYVPAVASLSVHNKGPHASKRYPLVIGSFVPFFDPLGEWYEAASTLPQTPAGAGNFVLKIPEAQFSPSYLAAPYPLSLVVCTNGGARFVSLGQIPIPIIDPTTGYVDNADVVISVVPPQGNSAAPSSPLIGKKAAASP